MRGSHAPPGHPPRRLPDVLSASAPALPAGRASAHSDSDSEPTSSAAAARPPARGASSTAIVRHNSKVSVACQACKARKTKCSGQPGPCSSCQKHRTVCEFDETLDSRRKQTRKRQMDDHARDRRRLDLLIASLKHGGSTHLVELIHTIRNDASLEDIEAFLLAHPVQVSTLNSPSPIPALGYGDVQRFSSDPVSQPMPMRKAVDLAILFNPPVLTVTAAPWTSISQDSQFISHLVSLWFRWMNPLAFSIDSDHFMADMLAGNPSIYCSPFLMSSILAVASLLVAEDISSYAVHGDRIIMGNLFYEEARRAYMLEQDQPQLTTIQALCHLSLFAKCMGRAWAGNLLHAMAVRTGKQIGLFATANPQWSPVRSDARSAQTLTAWMLYIRDTITAQGEQKVGEVPQPSKPIWPIKCDESFWTPYPKSSPSVESHISCVRDQLCSYAILADHMNHTLFEYMTTGLTAATLMQQAQRLVDQVRQWREQWPPCLAMSVNALPHTFYLHMFHRGGLLVIFNRLVELLSSMQDAALLAEAQSMVVAAALETSWVAGTYQQTYPVGMALPSMRYYANLTIRALVLSDLGLAPNKEAFLTILGCCCKFAMRDPLANAVVQDAFDHVQHTTRADELPQEITQALARLSEALVRAAAATGGKRKSVSRVDEEMSSISLYSHLQDMDSGT